MVAEEQSVGGAGTGEKLTKQPAFRSWETYFAITPPSPYIQASVPGTHAAGMRTIL